MYPRLRSSLPVTPDRDSLYAKPETQSGSFREFLLGPPPFDPPNNLFFFPTWLLRAARSDPYTLFPTHLPPPLHLRKNFLFLPRNSGLRRSGSPWRYLLLTRAFSSSPSPRVLLGAAQVSSIRGLALFFPPMIEEAIGRCWSFPLASSPVPPSFRRGGFHFFFFFLPEPGVVVWGKTSFLDLRVVINGPGLNLPRPCRITKSPHLPHLSVYLPVCDAQGVSPF